ncbi:MAG: TonB-dependent receptor [Marinilabiliaceae bacterium]|nr:TonB-dependent receptor [Marinilabiliaceae bacterium]
MKRKLVFLIMMAVCIVTGFAQSTQKLVRGFVTSADDGSPIPGVSVLVKGSTLGTITGGDGVYEILVPADATTLVFSFIGMETQEITVGGQTVINLVLKSEIIGVDEVVVIAYGTQSRKLNTGAIASVKSDDIKMAPVAGFESALQGRTSGVAITHNSGTPGAAISVRMRGATSISASNEPLYVIDGVPVTTGDFSRMTVDNGGATSGQGISALSDININDIESIQVLKDAASASMYGARAANGVILITTKRGKSGETKFNLDMYYGFQELGKKNDYMNAMDMAELRMEAYGGTVEDYLYYRDGKVVDTDWQDEIYKTAPISNYQLSASGGDEKTKYYASISYMDQEGIIENTAYSKLSGRVNLDRRESDKLNFGLNIGVSEAVNDRISSDNNIVNGVLNSIMAVPNNEPIFNEDGSYFDTQYPNPVGLIKEHNSKDKTLRILGNVFAQYKILPELTFKTSFGLDYLDKFERAYKAKVPGADGYATGGEAFEADARVVKLLNENTLTYMKEIDQHSFSLLGGISFEENVEERNYLQGIGIGDNKVLETASVITSASSSSSENRLNSLFSRLSYDYLKKYLFTASFRYDGSSRFGEDNKYALFPATSLGWRMTEESFMSNVSWINELKFRFGVGTTGNQEIGDFASRGTFSANTVIDNVLENNHYKDLPGIAPRALANPELKWETTIQYNYGVDIEFLSGRIALSAEYFIKKTKDLLLQRPIIYTSGYSSRWENIGKMENKGFEFSLTTQNLKASTANGISWTTTLNVSTVENEVTKLYNGEPFDEGFASRVEEGEVLGAFYMYKSLGVNPETGDLELEDLNGNNEVDPGDRQIVGTPWPDFYGGFNNVVAYKNFDLTFFFQFSVGNDILNGTSQYGKWMDGYDKHLKGAVDRWKQPGDITDYPRVFSPNTNEWSTYQMEDGSYLRLKTVSFGYNIPKTLLNRVGISSMRVYASGQNLLTFTDYSGYDPEVNYNGDRGITRGVDYYTYPSVRTITFGLNMSF